jgi:hypothetical protein
MPRQSTSPTALAQRIQQLLTERQQHEEAMNRIDQVLGRVSAALGARATGVAGRRPGKGTNGSIAKSNPTAGGPKRRKRRSFATTGEESILAFVKRKKNPTGREIESHWKSEGRGGPAANTLSKLVKEKRLKRQPVEEGRGSRYLLA